MRAAGSINSAFLQIYLADEAHLPQKQRVMWERSPEWYGQFSKSKLLQ